MWEIHTNGLKSKSLKNNWGIETHLLGECFDNGCWLSSLVGCYQWYDYSLSHTLLRSYPLDKQSVSEGMKQCFWLAKLPGKKLLLSKIFLLSLDTNCMRLLHTLGYANFNADRSRNRVAWTVCAETMAIGIRWLSTSGSIFFQPVEMLLWDFISTFEDVAYPIRKKNLPLPQILACLLLQNVC